MTEQQVAAATSLPAYLFRDCAERELKRIPHLMLVGNLRFSMNAILQWELTSSVPAIAAMETKPELGGEAKPTGVL